MWNVERRVVFPCGGCVFAVLSLDLHCVRPQLCYMARKAETSERYEGAFRAHVNVARVGDA
jgi:hypothetical protein